MSLKTEDPSAGELVARAVAAGEIWAATPAADRAVVLGAVADALDAAGGELVPVAQRETHLAKARLAGELQRTSFQLRLLARSAAAGEHLDLRIDHSDPEWPMGAARPDLRRTAVPLGPVLVFAASNFPFAFSVAGGDTASALAAGCPVLVKAHGGHPDLSDATARVVRKALGEAGAPDGLFALVHDAARAREVLTHPDVKAGAFTGSIPAGRALFDLAQSRPEPIPFYGELGSVNPVFVTARAAAGRAAEIVNGFVGSFTMGAGQFCTKPGVLLVPEDSRIVPLLREAVLPEAAPLLNDRITAGHQHTRERLEARAGVDVLTAGTSPSPAGCPAPTVLAVGIEDLLGDLDALLTECFGPTALVVRYGDEAQLLDVARRIDGQLTATLVAEEDDEIAPRLAGLLARKAGRILWNQWPTGVSVTYAQQHGGPYPATTAPATTSVGTAALARFVRPVAWQGFPQHLLPGELRDSPTAGAVRRIDGHVSGQERT
jgi:NADP-dependent aldehyde dehydrogenase